MKIVDKESACLKIANEIPDAIHDADHRSICKFQSLDSRNYTAVRDCFKELQGLLPFGELQGLPQMTST